MEKCLCFCFEAELKSGPFGDLTTWPPHAAPQYHQHDSLMGKIGLAKNWYAFVLQKCFTDCNFLFSTATMIFFKYMPIFAHYVVQVQVLSGFTTQSKHNQREHCKWPLKSKVSPYPHFAYMHKGSRWQCCHAGSLCHPVWICSQCFQLSHHQPNEVNSTVWLKLMALSPLSLAVCTWLTEFYSSFVYYHILPYIRRDLCTLPFLSPEINWVFFPFFLCIHIHLCVCVCVCIYIYIYVCIKLYMYV